jgi:DNA polymerase-3 subunit epsilon
VERAIRSLHGSPSFAIMDQGMNGDDRSCVLVIEGAFYGMGYIPKGMVAADTKSLLPYITPYRENSYIRNLVTGHAARFPEKVCPLSH